MKNLCLRKRAAEGGRHTKIMGQNDYLDFRAAQKRNSYRRRRRHPLPLLVLVILIILIIVGTIFLLIGENASENAEKPAPTAGAMEMDLTPTPTTAAILPTPTPPMQGETSSEKKEMAQGPFGLWEPTASPTPTIAIPEGEVIWMADYVDKRTPVEAKGVYLSPEVTKDNAYMEELLHYLDTTELNAVVIDVKADSGAIVYAMENDTAKEIGALRTIVNIPNVVKTLKEHGVYVIARLVAFKDPILAKARPDLTFYNKDGSKFYDSSRSAWVSPYKQEVWEYLASVGISCAEIGFDEINYDYMRFPTDGVANIDWGTESATKSKTEAITEGIKYLCETLRMHDVYVSADVYGIVISSKVDAAAVGQDYKEMSRYLDYICPMIYPSHYGFGYAGIDYPDKEPAKIIKMALNSSNKRIAEIPVYQHRAICRPWLQDFTASYLGSKNGVERYLVYDAEVLRIQMEATYESGLTDWLLWNAGGYYTEDAWLPEK